MTRLKIGRMPLSHLNAVLNSHGWINLCPAEETATGFRYPLTVADAVCAVTVSVERGILACQTDRRLSATDRTAVRDVVRHMLSMDFPLDEFQAACKARGATRFLGLARRGWGRMFRSPTCWEDAVKTLCTTNASWSYTQQMCRRLCDELGEATPSGLKAFPTPAKVLDAGERFLKKSVGMGYRSKSLCLLARRASSGEVPWLLDLSVPVDQGEAEKEIASWHGFGRYATRHLLVLMGFHDHLPVDREVGLHLGVRKAGQRDGKLDADHFTDWEKIGRNDLRISAYHEAGHAVVCRHFRIPWFLSRLERTTATMDILGAAGQLSYIKGVWATPFRLAAVGWAGVMAEFLLNKDDEYVCYETYTEFEELSPSDRTLVEGTLFRRRASTTAARILKRRWADAPESAQTEPDFHCQAVKKRAGDRKFEPSTVEADRITTTRT